MVEQRDAAAIGLPDSTMSSGPAIGREPRACRHSRRTAGRHQTMRQDHPLPRPSRAAGQAPRRPKLPRLQRPVTCRDREKRGAPLDKGQNALRGSSSAMPVRSSFRVGSRDSELLAPEFRPMDALSDQEPFTAWLRRDVGRDRIFVEPLFTNLFAPLRSSARQAASASVDHALPSKRAVGLGINRCRRMLARDALCGRAGTPFRNRRPEAVASHSARVHECGVSLVHAR
jgi:hypothetical protein